MASSAAVEALRELDVPPEGDLLTALAGAIDAAHRQIGDLVEQHPELDGTSTTLTAAIFDGSRLGIGHVGDSRGYLMRAGQLTQLTKDHTFVQSLIDEGRITEAESRVHPHRNLILRAVGVQETEPDLFLVDVQVGDRILLCSDGASGVLSDEDLARLLRAGTVENSAVDLVRDSLEAGSTDNVTVVVADVVDVEVADPDETQAMLVGPIVVGAAGERRRPTGRRRSRRHDTGDLEAVPAEIPGAVQTDVDPETVRYAPRAPRRFVWLRRLAVLLVVAVLVWVGSSAAYTWSQRQYYVAPASGKVAIYKGVEADIPAVQLHRVYQVSETSVSDLPDYNKGQVSAGMTTRNLKAARALVQRLDQAAACERVARLQALRPTPTATPTRIPTASPTAKPSSKASGAKSGTASGRSSATATTSPTTSVTSSPTASATSGSGSTSDSDCTDGG